MEADWTQPLVILASIFGVFLWLRNDIKNLRGETRNDMRELRAGVRSELQEFRAEIQSDLQRLETKVDGLDSRLRAVESEQSRVAGLLEGLGLAGVLPGKES
jgi:predicted nuclease with TOPRIM domain